jgi:hypothetical protein
MDKFLEKYIIGKMVKSKKFWYAVVGVLVTFLSDTFNLDPVQLESILYSIIALILGTGMADLGKDAKKQ